MKMLNDIRSVEAIIKEDGIDLENVKTLNLNDLEFRDGYYFARKVASDIVYVLEENEEMFYVVAKMESKDGEYMIGFIIDKEDYNE